MRFFLKADRLLHHEYFISINTASRIFLLQSHKTYLAFCEGNAVKCKSIHRYPKQLKAGEQP
jgi:hypothetical protein